MEPISIGILSFNQYGKKYQYSSDTLNNMFSKFDFSRGSPNIIVIGFQESRLFSSTINDKFNRFRNTFRSNDDEYDQNNLMVHVTRYLKNNNYTCVKKHKKKGLGEKGNMFLRGLRLRVYVDNQSLRRKDVKISSLFSVTCGLTNASRVSNISSKFNYLRKSQPFGKGAIGMTIKINDIDFFIVTAHLPFNDKLDDLGQSLRLGCLQQALSSSDVQRKPGFIFGDLNFRIRKNGEGLNLDNFPSNNFEYKDLKGFGLIDTLEKNVNNNLQLQEGVRNEGPTFHPTCKLLTMKKADNDCVMDDEGKISTKCYNRKKVEVVESSTVIIKRVPSYCDRILYSENINFNIRCEKYFALYTNDLKKSDHAAVGGLYTISKKSNLVSSNLNVTSNEPNLSESSDDQQETF